ncbi:MAG: RNA methyltransferase [Deltaproteobacteria bacterium]|jgi:tRNA (guanosine-2'-O-)-methyltransferase|nr:RNA methyltransferase [Deltaproteobacteria bacterium]
MVTHKNARNSQNRTDVRLEKIRRVLENRQKDLTLVLANIHDPHNVSAIYRSCDAFGVAGVHLYYTDVAFPHLAEKSSASARKWVQSFRHNSAADLKAALQERGMRVYATSCSPQARPLGDFDFTKPSAIILGNEHSGVAPELAGLADAEVYIPMFGMIQSFNVSVAAAVILYEAARQRRAAGLYDEPTYDAAELEALYELWASM